MLHVIPPSGTLILRSHGLSACPAILPMSM
jgi:hypothetical protein